MISVSDAARFAEESVAIKSFKPWWEIVIDYIILALLLITLLSWTRVISADASGLLCLPVEKTIDFSFNFAKYFNSRCAQEFNGKLLLYYPYLLFIQWMSLFLIQKAWLKVPVVTSKFDSYYDIFHEIYSIQPKFKRDPYNLRMLPEFKYDNKQKRCIKVLHDKLMLLLTDKTYLVWVYVGKLVVLYTICLGYFCAMLYWSLSLDFFQTEFQCDLRNNNQFLQINILVCNFSPAFFLYGVVLVNIVLLTIILFVNFYGVYWVLTQRRFGDRNDLFGNMKDYYAGLPGFKDLQFCVALMGGNVKDGNVMQEVLKACLKGNTQQFDTSNEAGEQETDGIVKKPSFIEEYQIVQSIAERLGLEIVKNDQSPKHLYDCLEYVKNTLFGYDVNVTYTLRDQIVQEIEKNVLQFKSIIDNDPDSPDYLTVIDNIKNEAVYGCQYAVFAVANILNVRIVIIHCHISNGFNEVFEPIELLGPGFQLPTRFLTFVSPHYFHATKFIKTDNANTDEVKEKRTRYASDERYRHFLRQASVRKVGKNEDIQQKAHRRRRKMSLKEEQSIDVTSTFNVALGKYLLGKLDFIDDGDDSSKPGKLCLKDLPDYCSTQSRNATEITLNKKSTKSKSHV